MSTETRVGVEPFVRQTDPATLVGNSTNGLPESSLGFQDMAGYKGEEVWVYKLYLRQIRAPVIFVRNIGS